MGFILRKYLHVTSAHENLDSSQRLTISDFLNPQTSITMVLIQRATPSSQVGASPFSPMNIPMGTDAHSSQDWSSFTSASNSCTSARNSSPPYSKGVRKFTFNHTWKPTKWFVVMVYIAAIVSWIMALRLHGEAKALIVNLESQEQTHLFHMDQELTTYKDTKSETTKSKKQISKLKKAKLALEHEVRTFQALNEDGEHMSLVVPPKGAEETIVKSWLVQRRGKLQRKIRSMQRFLQEASKQAVLKKYGDGPHKVRFTVAYTDLEENTSTDSFVVQMVPLDLMPHSIEFFLDMIGSKIWDNTVFLHHAKVEHVLAAAPIDYLSQNVKHHHLKYLGWQGLGFPEYSEKQPHKSYTIGFSGTGPTFYINTMDNSAVHGPGGQGHHVLAEDADPCFGEVVEGKEAVDTLVMHGLNQNAMRESDKHPWASKEHTWTHIVKIELVK